jgi:sulfide:quinone oxidoreductase
MPTAQKHVVIVGGGIAALETLMALRAHAERRVRVTLVAPEDEFTQEALRTAVPFSVDHVRHHALSDIALEFHADLVSDAVREVDLERHAVTCVSGATVEYDVLVLTPGARPYPAFEHALTFGLAREPDALNGILADIEQGYTRSVAFVVPPGVSWPLPLYELALMTARHAWSMGIDDAELTFITPESSPLAIFGPQPSDAVANLLEEAGIEFRPDAYATIHRGGRITLRPGGEAVDVGRTVTLPLLEGPRLAGVPFDEQGFIPVDDHGRVANAPDVYAAGDATDFAVKQGGIGCQQADAVAEHIALEAGAPIEPAPFRPVLRGKLLTGAGAQFLRHDLRGGSGESTTSQLKLWAGGTKVAGRYLGPWLARADADAADHVLEDAVPPVELVDVEVPLSPELRTGDNPMELDSLGVMRREGRHFARVPLGG